MKFIINESFATTHLDEYSNISLYLHGGNGLIYEIFFFSLTVRILKYFLKPKTGFKMLYTRIYKNNSFHYTLYGQIDNFVCYVQQQLTILY